ncbi:methyltransferase domain-containing protein [Streptomyces sp. NPDC050803]|uniref:class I SAM-dependent methyltransferase n=1 Tax=unclassified Streptomyces TaxID=2593676 RepID=UPI003439337E
MPASGTLSSRRPPMVVDTLATGGTHRSNPSTQALHRALGPQTGSAICDIACGTGRLALSFAADYPARLVGVDPEPARLAAFRALAAARSVAVQTVRADAAELPFPDGSFDLVTCRLAAHRFPDVPRAVGEMARLLRPGGRLAVIDLEGHEDPEIDALGNELEVLRDPTHRRSHTRTEWIALLKGAGLRVPVARGGQTEDRADMPVRRRCDSAATATEASVRRRLAQAPAAHREALGIRAHGDAFLVPLRTCLVIGIKPRGGGR